MDDQVARNFNNFFSKVLPNLNNAQYIVECKIQQSTPSAYQDPESLAGTNDLKIFMADRSHNNS